MSLHATAWAQAMAPGVPECIGHYRILRLIAQGGMGAVYEAEPENRTASSRGRTSQGR
jgi:hypothetical protein